MGTALSTVNGWYQDDDSSSSSIDEQKKDSKEIEEQKKHPKRNRASTTVSSAAISENETNEEEIVETSDQSPVQTSYTENKSNNRLRIAIPGQQSEARDDHKTENTRDKFCSPEKNRKLDEIVSSSPFSMSVHEPPTALYVLGPPESGKIEWVQNEWLPCLKKVLSVDRVTVFPSTRADTSKYNSGISDIVDLPRQRSVLEAAVQPTKTFLYTITTSHKPSKWWVIIFDRKAWTTTTTTTLSSYEDDDIPFCQNHDDIQLMKTLFFYRKQLGIIPVCVMDTDEIPTFPKHVIDSFYTTADRALFQTQGLQPDRQEVAHRTPSIEERTKERLESDYYYVYLHGRHLPNDSQSHFPRLYQRHH
jgi:hypothetical protein